MSRYQPTDIAAQDLQVALNPAIGGEHKVYASYDPWVHAGTITQPAENSGVLALEATFDNNVALDFQVTADRTFARSSVALKLSVNVTFEDDTTGIAEANFPIPERVANQTYNIGQGAATDLIGLAGNSAKRIKTLHSINPPTGGAAGNRFRIMSLPVEGSYFLVGCTNGAGLTLPIGASLAIPCGLNSSAFVKRGRGEPGKLEVDEKYVDYMSGLGRLNGAFVTAKVEIVKDERLLTDRIVVGNWKPLASPKFGDGDDVTMQKADGNFETFAIFTAR